MDIDPSECHKAAAAVEGAFDWSATTEGSEYWVTVTEKLRAYAEQVERTAHIRAELTELRARIVKLEKSL